MCNGWEILKPEIWVSEFGDDILGNTHFLENLILIINFGVSWELWGVSVFFDFVSQFISSSTDWHSSAVESLRKQDVESH